MLEKRVGEYRVALLSNQETLCAAYGSEKQLVPIEDPQKIQSLEQKFLTLFGIWLQLTVFYIPLINIIFRGKAMPGIIS